MYDTTDRRPEINTDKMFSRTDNFKHIPWEEDTITIKWHVVLLAIFFVSFISFLLFY
jgi:hypothetical protein